MLPLLAISLLNFNVHAANLDEDSDAFAAQVNKEVLLQTQQNQAKLKDSKTTPQEAAKIQIAQVALNEQVEANATKFPKSYAVQGSAAAAAVQAGDWKKGQVYADRAVAIAEEKKNPQQMADALRTRAIGAYQAGDYEKATADSKRVLDFFPKDKDARVVYEFSKGRVKSSSGGIVTKPIEQTESVAAWPAELPRPSIWSDPRVVVAGVRADDHLAAMRKSQEALQAILANDPRRGLDLAGAAQKLDPGLTDAYFQKALAWKALSDLANALTEVTRAIGLWTIQGNTKNLPGAYALRSQIRNEMGDYPLALSDAQKAIAYDANFAPGFLQRAKAGEKMGKDVEKAIDDYKRASELNPEFRAEYEAAVTRLAAGAKPAAPAPDKSKGWLNAAISAAVALLVLLIGAIWLLVKRKRPEAAIGFGPGDRKELDSHYDIVGELGEGGMGAVYKGYDKVLKRPVAIKRLRAELQANPRERDRFIREAELVASLHHPHIVDIYTIIRDKQDTYLVFEFVSGMTVHDLLNESPGRRLPAPRALEILRQIAEAVDHAHSRHVIHRDMKPSNVMLADGGWVKVMDFGIARQVKDSLLTTTNTIVGTPVYMAPEQAMGAVVKESDVFALGVTLYELLTGALPFKGPNEMGDKMEGRFVAPSVVVPELPKALDAVIGKALSARAEERYHRCGDLYNAALKALDGRVTPATQR